MKRQHKWLIAAGVFAVIGMAMLAYKNSEVQMWSFVPLALGVICLIASEE